MVNLNLGNQRYKEKGKELGLPFVDHELKLSSNHSQEQGWSLVTHKEELRSSKL